MSKKSPLVALVALSLWLLTAGVGLWEVFLIREMTGRIVARLWADDRPFGPDYWTAVHLGQWSVLIAGLAWIVLVIGSGEFHYRHYGERASWHLFAVCVAIEVGIALLALWI